tara:strand:+ start:1100 stop:1537 length:438 start_codon:yes stop_codon:yes gene_type:complete
MILKLLKNIKFFFFLFCALLFIFLDNSQLSLANSMDSYQNQPIVEELRLKVPLEFKEVWLENEAKIWDPWLSIQNGYLGRKIFWNKQKEEALILVTWENRTLWKSISMIEVNKIQEKFEENVKTSLNLKENPFELIYEGELEKQG